MNFVAQFCQLFFKKISWASRWGGTLTRIVIAMNWPQKPFSTSKCRRPRSLESTAQSRLLAYGWPAAHLGEQDGQASPLASSKGNRSAELLGQPSSPEQPEELELQIACRWLFVDWLPLCAASSTTSFVPHPGSLHSVGGAFGVLRRRLRKNEVLHSDNARRGKDVCGFFLLPTLQLVLVTRVLHLQTSWNSSKQWIIEFIELPSGCAFVSRWLGQDIILRACAHAGSGPGREAGPLEWQGA